MSSLGSILIRPVVSEKMTKQAERLSQYAFIVAENANRIQIARAIEDFYGVRVESVNTMRYEDGRALRKEASLLVVPIAIKKLLSNYGKAT